MRREVGAASVCVTVVSDDGNITVLLASSSDQVSSPVVLNKDIFNPQHCRVSIISPFVFKETEA